VVKGKELAWKQRVAKQWNRNGIVYVVLIPVMLHYFIFQVIPLLFSAYLTFTNWSIVGTPKFVGFANWIQFFDDPIAWKAIGNTLLFSFYYIIPTMALGLILALLVNSKIRFAVVYKSIFFLPVVTSFVVLSGIWDWIFKGTEFGLMNYMLHFVGIQKQLFFSDGNQAMIVLAALSIFKVAGVTMVYYYSGLLSIPTHLYEAARIDGASGWHSFWRITFPLLLPIHFYVAVVTTIGSFQVFDSAYLLTNGGPNYATTTIVFYMYQSAFVSFRLGYASVIAYVLFFIVFIISMIQKKFLGKEISYY
jgi:ABC-type sugar transport system permease subunit